MAINKADWSWAALGVSRVPESVSVYTCGLIRTTGIDSEYASIRVHVSPKEEHNFKASADLGKWILDRDRPFKSWTGTPYTPCWFRPGEGMTVRVQILGPEHNRPWGVEFEIEDAAIHLDVVNAIKKGGPHPGGPSPSPINKPIKKPTHYPGETPALPSIPLPKPEPSNFLATDDDPFLTTLFKASKKAAASDPPWVIPDSAVPLAIQPPHPWPLGSLVTVRTSGPTVVEGMVGKITKIYPEYKPPVYGVLFDPGWTKGHNSVPGATTKNGWNFAGSTLLLCTWEEKK